MNLEQKLKDLNITLPKAPDPVGAYVAFKKVGNLLYISGQLPIDLDGNIIKGTIGKDLNLEDGKKASKLCALNIWLIVLVLCFNINIVSVKPFF